LNGVQSNSHRIDRAISQAREPLLVDLLAGRNIDRAQSKLPGTQTPAACNIFLIVEFVGVVFVAVGARGLARKERSGNIRSKRDGRS
jgi:hypothetical protein